MVNAAEQAATGITNKDKVDALLQQMTALRSEMGLMMKSAHQVLTAGVAAISVLGAVVVGQNLFDDPAMMASLGFGLSLIMFFLLVTALALHANVLTHALHIEAMEQTANRLLGEDLLHWTDPDALPKKTHDGPSAFIYVIVAVALLGAVLLAALAVTRHSVVLGWAVAGTELALSVVLVWWFRRNWSLERTRVLEAYGVEDRRETPRKKPEAPAAPAQDGGPGAAGPSR